MAVHKLEESVKRRLEAELSPAIELAITDIFTADCIGKISAEIASSECAQMHIPQFARHEFERVISGALTRTVQQALSDPDNKRKISERITEAIAAHF